MNGASLAMQLVVGFPTPWPAASRKSVADPCSFLLKIISETTVFGRPLAQLILAALSLHPLEVEESLARRSLSDVPFVRFPLFTYPLGRFFRNYVFLRGASAGPGRSGLKGT